MSEEQQMINELEKIEMDFKARLNQILGERDRKIAEILKNKSEEEQKRLSSEIIS